MGAEGRSVRFTEDEGRSRVPRSRDSGLAKDIEDQRFNLRALQEALESSNEDANKYKNKALGLDAELSNARRTIRDKETLLRECITENQTLRDENDFLRDENFDLRQQLADASLVDGEYMMSGGSGESSNGVTRSKSKRRSKHGSPDMKDQMKERINRGNPEAEASSSKMRKDPEKERKHRRSESKTRKAYVEEAPTIVRGRTDRTRPPVTQRFVNYTTEPSVSSHASIIANPSVTPRTMGGPAYSSLTETGDYVPKPLPREKHTSDRGRRHH